MTHPRPAAYVHEACLSLGPDSDPAAPGAAVTVALCGTWEHGGPCRWSHRTAPVRRIGPTLDVRILFVCDLAEERDLRSRIVTALAAGHLAGPGGESHWTLVAEEAGSLSADEQVIGARLIAT